MAAHSKTIDPVKYFRDYLDHDIRPDGRKLDQFRSAIVNVKSISTADGSAIVKIGGTTVVCGVKLELGTPKAEDSGSGWLVPNVTLPPLCSSRFHPGPPSDEAQVASNLLAETLNNASVVDRQKLCVVPERLAWAIYLDAICLNHDGSLMDACVVAAVAALRSVRIPRVEYDAGTDLTRVFPDEKTPLNISGLPVPSTHAIFDEVILTDPTSDEEALASSLITVTIQDKELVSVYKPGGSNITEIQLQECIARAETRAAQMKSLLDTACREDNQEQRLIGSAADTT